MARSLRKLLVRKVALLLLILEALLLLLLVALLLLLLVALLAFQWLHLGLDGRSGAKDANQTRCRARADARWSRSAGCDLRPFRSARRSLQRCLMAGT